MMRLDLNQDDTPMFTPRQVDALLERKNRDHRLVAEAYFEEQEEVSRLQRLLREYTKRHKGDGCEKEDKTGE